MASQCLHRNGTFVGNATRNLPPFALQSSIIPIREEAALAVVGTAPSPVRDML